MSPSFSAASLALLSILSPSSIVDLGDRLLAKARQRPPLSLIVAASRQHIEDAYAKLRQAGASANGALGKLLALGVAASTYGAKANDTRESDGEGDGDAGSNSNDADVNGAGDAGDDAGNDAGDAGDDAGDAGDDEGHADGDEGDADDDEGHAGLGQLISLGHIATLASGAPPA
jgi:hypothetical protein